jgi:hypothetical protein
MSIRGRSPRVLTGGPAHDEQEQTNPAAYEHVDVILKMWVKVSENGWVKVGEKLPPQVVDRS